MHVWVTIRLKCMKSIILTLQLERFLEPAITIEASVFAKKNQKNSLEQYHKYITSYV